MPRPKVTIQAGIAEGEFQPTLTQLTEVAKSCLKANLDLLNASQKSQLKSVIADLRTDVGKAGDLLKARQGRTRAAITRLQTELSDLNTGQTTLSDFFRLMSQAIASCPDAEQAATKIKKTTDRVLQQATELNFRIAIAQIQEGQLDAQIAEADSTIGVLDRINLVVG